MHVILFLHGNDSSSSVQLLSEDLVGIDESFEFLGQVVVLPQQHSRVSFEGVFFDHSIVEVASEVSVGENLPINVLLANIEILIPFFDSNFVASNRPSEINIPGLDVFNMFFEVIAVRADSINVLPKCSNLNALTTIEVLQPGYFSLGVIQLDLSVSNVEVSGLDKFLSLQNLNVNFLQVILKRLQSINLIKSLSRFHVHNVSKSLDFSEHVGSLRLHEVNVSFQLSYLTSEIDNLITPSIAFIPELARLEKLLI